MSGGHFNYDQYRIGGIADEIENIIRNNDDTSKNEWGDVRGHGFSEETIEQFKKAVCVLRCAEVYAQRVDWLVSGDDGEEQFVKRLIEDLLRVQCYD
jgi:hypothetical protein